MEKYGFLELSRKPLCDIGAVAAEYKHEKSGARLLHLDRRDVNKTFMIAFKTPPSDDTGVFHIIEHSVLCGSRKYPIKEPFVELLKGSLNTFLNAMTYPDKTVYPVSSMNDKDFYNLVSVYMDAVFNPSLLENENIFLQEGHRLEIKDGELSENGVVLNEMLGAYSSPEEIECENIMAMMYPDSPYAYSSGGAPESISQLTREDFLCAYKKHYTAKNSYIILDGDVNLEEILPLLDSYLSPRGEEGEKIEILPSPAALGGKREVSYPINEGESTKSKTRMALGIRGFRFDEREKSIALAVIRSALASSQNSPFCRAVLGTGLCEDVCVAPIEEVRDGGMYISFVNVKDGECEELLSFALGELWRYVREGIDKEALRSALSSIEFVTREKNFGSLPAGVVYALGVMESWLYSDNPTQNLEYSDVFASLRGKIDSGYYEDVLSQILPKVEEATVLIMKPDCELDRQTAEKNRVRLSEIYRQMNDSQKEELRRENLAFDAWQSARDTKEALMCLPHLSLSDINPAPTRVAARKRHIGGRYATLFDIETSGISYVNAFFDVSDLTLPECTDLSLLSLALSKMPTELHSEGELVSYIKGKLGFFTFSPITALHERGGRINNLKLSVGVLSENADEVRKILSEVIYGSIFTPRILETLIKRICLDMKESLSSDGATLALDRAQSAFSAANVANEYYFGYEAYRIISAYAEDGEEIEKLAKRLKALAERIFVRERVRLFGAGTDAERILYDISDILKSGEPSVKISHKPLDIKHEGIEISSRTSFTALGFPLPRRSYTSAYDVVKTILNYEFLWNEIRAVGGAYGAGEVLRDGFGAFYSYRDPSPERSLDKYLEIPSFLENLAKTIEKEELEKYIIGAFSATDGVRAARLSFDIECARVLRGITYDTRKLRREQMLGTQSSDILRFAKLLSKKLSRAVSCTVASEEMLSKAHGWVEDVKRLK